MVSTSCVSCARAVVRQCRISAILALAKKEICGGAVYPGISRSVALAAILPVARFYLVAPDTRYRRKASSSAAVLLVVSKGRNISKPSPSG